MAHLKVKTVALALVASCALMLAGAGAADAGTNGQQIFFYNRVSTYIVVYGQNQNGNWEEYSKSVSRYSNVYTTNWWWVGQVEIVGSDARVLRCYVPQEYDYNTFNCGWLS